LVGEEGDPCPNCLQDEIPGAFCACSCTSCTRSRRATRPRAMAKGKGGSIPGTITPAQMERLIRLGMTSARTDADPCYRNAWTVGPIPVGAPAKATSLFYHAVRAAGPTPSDAPPKAAATAKTMPMPPPPRRPLPPAPPPPWAQGGDLTTEASAPKVAGEGELNAPPPPPEPTGSSGASSSRHVPDHLRCECRGHMFNGTGRCDKSHQMAPLIAGKRYCQDCCKVHWNEVDQVIECKCRCNGCATCSRGYRTTLPVFTQVSVSGEDERTTPGSGAVTLPTVDTQREQ